MLVVLQASTTPVTRQRVLAPDESILSCLPGSEVLIVGYFTQLAELCVPGKLPPTHAPLPIVYWEQGRSLCVVVVVRGGGL